MKKLVGLIITLIIVFSIFLFFYFKKTSYELEYTLNEVKIKESYNKELEYYLFELEYQDVKYGILSFDKYTNKRKLITDIKITEEDGLTCLNPQSMVATYEVCSKDGKLITNSKVNKESKKADFANYEIYDLNNRTYMLWNYDKLILLNKDKQKEIKVFSKDIYNLEMVTKYQDYLVLPDYNEDFTFKKLYLINKDDGKIKNIDLRYTLYLDSYFLGDNKNNLYIYDKKEKQEYYIDMKKERIYETNNKILKNGEWIDASSFDLERENVRFTNDLVFNYSLIDNKLYSFINDDKYVTEISDMEVNTIVEQDNLGVYFISKDSLYYYNPFDGIKLVLKCEEWNFNYNNRVFIF